MGEVTRQSSSLVLVSGGMDSVTLLHRVRAEGHHITMLSFNYGQRHEKELFYANWWADEFGYRHIILPIPNIGKLIESSVLTGEGEIPEGHYAEDNMSLTVVPFRNPLMLSAAYAIASSLEIDRVCAAMHAGDHFVYPDCRPQFTQAFTYMAAEALQGFWIPAFYAPFLNVTKATIAKIGESLGVRWDKTWSCYKGGDIHCGRCGTCVERLEALCEAQADDSTHYEDHTYWRKVTNR